MWIDTIQSPIIRNKNVVISKIFHGQLLDVIWERAGKNQGLAITLK